MNRYHDASVDFFNPDAVMMLNRALLKHFYRIDRWDIPRNYLCPPIPGRADYVHYAADLLGSKNNGDIPKGEKIHVLDIGTGASAVYPIIGSIEYGWSFVGSEIDPVAFESSSAIVRTNSRLDGILELRRQQNAADTFRGIMKDGERFDLTVCNPPFHASAAEAREGAVRKLSHLKRAPVSRPKLNFGGQPGELWCDGGEAGFIRRMIHQSREFGGSCFWFTTLVSKQSSLRGDSPDAWRGEIGRAHV